MSYIKVGENQKKCAVKDKRMKKLENTSSLSAKREEKRKKKEKKKEKGRKIIEAEWLKN